MAQPLRLLGISSAIRNHVWESETLIRVGWMGALEIVLNDTSVSRRHALIRNVDDVWWISDLNSVNGTYVNGVRLRDGERQLRSRDVIQFGHVATLVELVGEPIESLDLTHMPGEEVWIDFGADRWGWNSTPEWFFNERWREEGPACPVALDPRWLTSAVLDLAQTIRDERAFDLMPILADALMDAGCAEDEIILHCRDAHPHIGKCWVLDLLLGNDETLTNAPPTVHQHVARPTLHQHVAQPALHQHVEPPRPSRTRNAMAPSTIPISRKQAWWLLVGTIAYLLILACVTFGDFRTTRRLPDDQVMRLRMTTRYDTLQTNAQRQRSQLAGPIEVVRFKSGLPPSNVTTLAQREKLRLAFDHLAAAIPEPAHAKPTPDQLNVAKAEFRKAKMNSQSAPNRATKEKLPTFTFPSNTTDSDLKEIPNLQFRFALSLAGSKVTDAGLKELKQLDNLTGLYLDNCKQLSDEGIAELARLEQLTILSLRHTRVTDIGVHALANMPNLAYLDLFRTNATGAGIANLKNLVWLDLSGSMATNAGLADVRELKNLKYLDLRGADLGSRVTDSGLKELAELQNLIILFLNGTQATGAGIGEVRRALPKCHVFD